MIKRSSSNTVHLHLHLNFGFLAWGLTYLLGLWVFNLKYLDLEILGANPADIQN